MLFAGRYEVLSLVGEGRSKRVYRVHDHTLDREVALARIKAVGLSEAGRERIARAAGPARCAPGRAPAPPMGTADPARESHESWPQPN